MTELERVKELTPKFQLTVLLCANRIETVITEMISVEVCKKPKDIYKRVEFFNYFEDNFRLQYKIDLLKIILKNNHPGIFKKFPNYFNQLNEVKKIRNSIAHSEVQYERDSNEKNAKLILHHPRIKKQMKLKEKQMLNIIKKAEKVSEDTRKIWILVSKSKGLRF